MQSYWYNKKKFKDQGATSAFWILALVAVVMMLIATLFPACFADPAPDEEPEQVVSDTIILEEV